MPSRFNFLVLALVAVAPIFAQATAVVQISGVITDPNGGLIPHAQIKATQTDTGLVRTTATGADGSYLLSNLPIGPYRLEASAEGFQTRAQTGIVLQVNTNPTINLTLAVGSVTQAVEVAANATMVEAQRNGI